MKELLLLTLALAACAGLVFWLTQREIAKVLECAEDEND